MEFSRLVLGIVGVAIGALASALLVRNVQNNYGRLTAVGWVAIALILLSIPVSGYGIYFEYKIKQQDEKNSERDKVEIKNSVVHESNKIVSASANYTLIYELQSDDVYWKWFSKRIPSALRKLNALEPVPSVVPEATDRPNHVIMFRFLDDSELYPKKVEFPYHYQIFETAVLEIAFLKRPLSDAEITAVHEDSTIPGDVHASSVWKEKASSVRYYVGRREFEPQFNADLILDSRYPTL